MKLYGQLEDASLEQLATDPAANTQGRIFTNTTEGRTKTDDGVNKRALIRNDQKMILGNDVTAANNVRLHRGSSSLLQVVLGGDVTAEGSPSNVLAKFSSKLEAYSNAGRPAVGNAGRQIWNTDVSEVQVDTGAAWITVAAVPSDGSISVTKLAMSAYGHPRFINGTLTASVGGNALTIAVKTAAGTDPTALNPVVCVFRDSVATGGLYSTISITSALSITVPTGATLGQTAAVNQYVWVYLLNDAGVVDIAVSGVDVFLNENLNSATAVSAGSTSGSTLYSVAAHVGSKPTIICGRLLVNEAIAGTWGSNPTALHLSPNPVTTTTDWALDAVIGFSAVSGGLAKGTTSTDRMLFRRDGNVMYMRGEYRQTAAGATGSGLYLAQVAAGRSINTALVSSSTDTTSTLTATAAAIANTGNGWIAAGPGNDRGPLYPRVYDATHLSFGIIANGSIFGLWQSGNFSFNNNALAVAFEAAVPIVGWSKYGP